MQIERRDIGDVTILDLTGKMTLGEGDELLKDCVNQLIAQGRRKLVLDLGQVPYIDSAGNGEIVRTFTTVARQGGRLVICHPTQRIINLWIGTKLLTVFETYDSEADAVRSFSAWSPPERGTYVEWSCPMCRAAIPLLAGSASTRRVCIRCTTTFELEVSAAAVRVIRAEAPVHPDDPTGNHARLTVAPPARIELPRQLNLFATESVDKLLQLLPAEHRCIIQLDDDSKLTEPAINWLARKYATSDGGVRYVVLCRNPQLASSLVGIRTYDSLERAAEALGNPTSSATTS